MITTFTRSRLLATARAATTIAIGMCTVSLVPINEPALAQSNVDPFEGDPPVCWKKPYLPQCNPAPY